MDMGNTPNGPHQPHQQHQQSIHHINDFDDYTNLISNPTCVIKFTAEWCGPCKAIAPIYEKLADEHHEKITFIEINVDTAKQITNYEDVKSIPCFKFYYNNEKLDALSFQGSNVKMLERRIEILLLKLDHINYMTSYDDYMTLINTSPCVVKFTATWCGPCKKIAPLYKTLAHKYHDKVNFLEVDVNHVEEIADHEDIKSIPTFIFYHNKVKLDNLGFTNCNNETLIDNMETFISTINDVQGLQELQEAQGAQESSESIKSDENNEYGEDIDVPIEKVNQ